MEINIKDLVDKVFKTDIYPFIYDIYIPLISLFPEEDQTDFLSKECENILLDQHSRLLKAKTIDDISNSCKQAKSQFEKLEKSLQYSMNKQAVNMVVPIIKLLKTAYITPFE